jgi:hypothetical protein
VVDLVEAKHTAQISFGWFLGEAKTATRAGPYVSAWTICQRNMYDPERAFTAHPKYPVPRLLDLLACLSRVIEREVWCLGSRYNHRPRVLQCPRPCKRTEKFSACSISHLRFLPLLPSRSRLIRKVRAYEAPVGLAACGGRRA